MHPPSPLSLSPSSSPPLALSHATTERCRRRRRTPPRPSPLPRLSVLSRGSASTPRSPKTKHAPAGRPKRLHHLHLRRRPPEIPLAAPFAPVIPRARRPPHDDHRELLPILPLSIRSTAHRSNHTALTRTRRRLLSSPTCSRPTNGPAVVPKLLTVLRRARRCHARAATATTTASPRTPERRPPPQARFRRAPAALAAAASCNGRR